MQLTSENNKSVDTTFRIERMIDVRRITDRFDWQIDDSCTNTSSLYLRTISRALF